MKRLSFLVKFAVPVAVMIGFASAPAVLADPAENDFAHIPGTIFQKTDSDSDGIFENDDEEFAVPLAILDTYIQYETDTSVPVDQYFPVSSPCLNRLSHAIADWIDDSTSLAGIYVPGDSVPTTCCNVQPFESWLIGNNDNFIDYQQDYEDNFFQLLQWAVERSKIHHPTDCFDGGGGGEGGGGESPPSEGSGSYGVDGWSVASPDPAQSEDEWDLDEFDNPFEEQASDCKETVRWLLNMSHNHFPKGGTTPGMFRDRLRPVFDEICLCDGTTPNDMSDCPPYASVGALPICDDMQPVLENDGLPACPDELFGSPINCFPVAAKAAYTTLISNYNFNSTSTCPYECEDDGTKNQRIRDAIAMEMAARFQLVPTCGDRDCETALKFREVYDANDVTMSAMDYDFLYELGGCSDCYGVPTNPALGMLDPTEPGGNKGTGDGSFRCDWDFDGEQTPMDAVLFARATMRGDAAASTGMAFPSPVLSSCPSGSYSSTYMNYSRYDWAEQYLINTEQSGTSCDLLTCEGRAAFVETTSDLFERHWEDMGLPPGYNPSPPSIEDLSRPRENDSSGGVAFPEDTGTGESPCEDEIPDQPMMSTVHTPPADEASGDDGDLDATVAETCPPTEEPASTSISGSPATPYSVADNSNDPVRLTTGEKVESAVDLVIPLAGKDFRLVRNYRSLGALDDGSQPTPYDGVTGGNLVGNFWTMPLTKWIDETGLAAQDPYVVLNSSEGPKHIRLHTETEGTWGEWRGQRTQRFIAKYSPVLGLDGSVVPDIQLPVWRLIQPGSYTLEFWRGDTGSSTIWAPENAQVGRLVRRIDAAGNIWQFIYKEYYDGSTTPQIMDSRPIGIRFLRAPEPGTTDYIPVAELQLVWDDRVEVAVPGTSNPVTYVPNTNYARLREARVVRFGDETASVVTQRVLYTYFNSLFAGSGQPYNNDLGSDGDLIQVTKLTRVDGDTPEAEVWRTQITQYRYHSGNYSTSGSLDLSTPDPWDLLGHKHALKAVLYPEQIERFAFFESGVSGMEYIGDAAKTLLQMDDLNGSDEPLALDWAGKVITKYEPVFDGSTADFTQPFRVREQMMVADCGCSGTSAIQTRYTYDYFDLRHIPDPDPIEDDLVWTVHMTEWNYDGSDWVAQTKMMHDYVQQSPTQERLRLQHQVLAAPLVESTGATDGSTQYWVTRFEYDRRTPKYSDGTPRGTLALPRDVHKAILYPSAMATYSPATSGAMATYTAHSDEGLVLAFNHNEDGRLTQERVREGWHQIRDNNSANYETDLDQYTLVRYITRQSPLDSSYLQGFATSISAALPINEISYAGSGSSDPIVVGYRYALDAATDFSTGPRIHAIATIQNPATVAENGPGGTSVTDATRSIVIFDEAGEVQFTIDAKDSLTAYERQLSTGRVTSVSDNADTSSYSLPSLDFSVGNPNYNGFSGRSSEGGTLTTQIQRDALGRITTVTTPSGVKSSIVRSINSWEHTDPTNSDAVAYGFYTETTLPHYFEENGSVIFTAPASRTWFTAGGTALGAESYELDPASAVVSEEVIGHEDFRYAFGFANSGAAVSRSVSGYSRFGVLQLTASWPDLSEFSGRLSAAGSLAEPIKPRVSEFTYDYRGNLVESLSPDGSIQGTEYDILDRPIAISLGTDSSSGGSNNMVTVRQMWYDSDGTTTSGVGDGQLTLVRESPSTSTSDDRDTEMRYDYRGRLVTVINPLSPHAFFEFDNLDRTTTAMLFDDSSAIPSDLDPPASGTRLSKIDFYYDSQGRPYRRSVAIDPTGGTSGTLDEFMWYDRAGQAVAAQTPSAPKVKMRYDGLGRLISSYVTADTGEINPTVSGSHADTYDEDEYEPNLSGDIVYEQTEYEYITTGTIGLGQIEMVTTRARLHGTPDTTTGALGGGTPSINSYSGYYYDAASRLVHSVEFGTNDGDDRFIANSVAPDVDQADTSTLFNTPYGSLTTELQDALISSRLFDTRGRPIESLGPWREGVSTETRNRSLVFYNDLNELVGSIENAIANGSGDPAIAWNGTDRYAPAAGLGEYTAERSRAMSFNRNTIGQVTERMAWRDASNAQTTLYEYAHDISTPGLATNLAVNWLVRRINYPDESTGDPDPADPTLSEEFAYNQLGEVRHSLDQNSTQHTYTRDKLGRVTLDVASSISSTSGIDDSVLALKYTFDDAGRLQKVTSHSDLTATAPNTLNAMRYTYDSLWRLTQLEQNPLGDIGSNPSTGIVDIEYEDVAFNNASTFGTHNITRATDLKYPLGAQGASAARTVLTNTYGSAAGLNDIISRATGFQWNRASTGQTQTVSVERLGLAAPVKIEYGVPDLALDRIQANPILSPAGILEYKGLDRFGRIVDQRWIEPGLDSTTEQSNIAFGYTYNRIGNITERTDDRIGAGFSFRDEAYEFDELDRLVGMERTPSGANPFVLDWTLDTFGNWSNFSTTSGGSTTAETRTHNEANELVQRSVGGNSSDLTFDHAGNLIEQELTASSSREFVYDAWNRLVQVGYDTGTGTQERVRYRYYPDGERAASLVDSSIKAPILPDELNLFYYDASWRLLEIRADKTGAASWAFPSSTASFTLSNTRQFIWGEQYIDELVAYMSDTAAAINTDGTLSTGPTFATLEYSLTDRNFSVIGRGDTSNTLGDRIHYDPYGTFKAYPGGDVNRDGSTNSKDETAITEYLVYAVGYQAEYDLDLDGDVDARDITKVSSYGKRVIKSGQLSDRGNIVGWCGYLYEESTGMWLARHRWQIPELGRWANRDPIGYSGGGQNLYEYVNGNPVFFSDPLGLKKKKREKLTPQQIAEKSQNGFCDSTDRALARGPRCDESESEWEERRAGMIRARANSNCGGPPPGTDYSAAYWKGFKEGAIEGGRNVAVVGAAVGAGVLVAASPLTGGASGVGGAIIFGIITGTASGVAGATVGELYDVVVYDEKFEPGQVVVGGAVGAIGGGAFGLAGHGIRVAWNSTIGQGARSRAAQLFTRSRATDLRFSQTTASRTFQDGGPFGGQTISSVAARLRSGEVSVSQLPVQYVERNGVRLIVNTRSSLALRQAGVPEEQWVLVNRSGNSVFEAEMTARLARNGLDDLGVEALRVTGRGKGASCVCPE